MKETKCVTLLSTALDPEIDFFGDPVLNSAGTVADIAFLVALGSPEVFTARARGITPRNDPSNPRFPNAEHPSMNNSGAIAFAAIPLFAGETGPTGIFLEVSGGQSLIPVIRPGDRLLGSIVDHVDLGRFALNDRFQMAFSYTLTDGRSGLAVASYNNAAMRISRTNLSARQPAAGPIPLPGQRLAILKNE